MIVNDQSIVIFPKMHCSTGSFHAGSDFAPKKYDLGSFLNDWNGQMDMIRRSLSDRRD